MRPSLVIGLALLLSGCGVERGVTTFNASPDANINSHGDGDAVLEGIPVQLRGSLSDPDDANADLIGIWYQDGIQVCAGNASEDGTSLCELTFAMGGGQVVLEAHDPGSAVGSDTVSLDVQPPNTPNTPPSCSIDSPSSGTTVVPGEAVLFEGSASDAEVPSDRLFAEWSSDVDGALGSGNPTTAGSVLFSASALSAGPHIITLTVTDDAEAACTDAIILTVEAGNWPPTIAGASLTPVDPMTGQTLTCTPGATNDADGDPVSLTYGWTVNSVPVAVTSSVLSAGSRDDIISCHVTPNDGTIDGATATSADVTVQNTPPQFSLVTLSPSAVDGDTPVTALPSGWFDADGDAEDYVYDWTVNAAPAGTGTATLAASAYAPTDVVEVTVTSDDGIEFGAVLTASLVVGAAANSPPSITGALITPNPAYETSTMGCSSVGWFDADGDLDQSTISWFVNSGPVGSGASLSSGFTVGDTVACRVTPYDGTDTGPPMWASVIISPPPNSIPSIASVEIIPDPADDLDTLTCTWAGWTDIDGDLDQSTVEWFVNTASAGTGTTLSSGFAAGDTVECTVTPYDGIDTGTPMSDDIVIDSGGLVGADCMFPAEYTRIVHGEGNIDFRRVEFAPDGSYALILSAYSSDLYVYDPVAETLSLEASGGAEYWQTMAFHPSGYALIGGNDGGGTGAAPVLYKYDTINGMVPVIDITGVGADKLINVSSIEDIALRPGTEEFALLTDNNATWPTQNSFLHRFEPNWSTGVHTWNYEGGVSTSQGAASIDWGTNFGEQVILGNSFFTEQLYWAPTLGTPNLVDLSPSVGNLSKTVFNPADRSVAWIHNSSSNKIYVWNGAHQEDWNWDLGNWAGLNDFATTADGHWRIFVGRNGTIRLSDSDWYPIDMTKVYDNFVPGWGGSPYFGGSSDYLMGVAWQPGTCGGLIVGDATSSMGMVIKFEMPN